MNKHILRGLVAAGVFGVATLANAAAGDVDTTAITGAGTQIALVGAAVFTVYVGIKLYKWIRRAL